MSNASLIDVHAHFTTERYIECAKAAGHVRPDGMPESAWPHWSAERHLALMGRIGVRTSVLSISSPGIEFPGESVPDLAAEVNDAAAAVVREYPGKFGFFASLPLLDELAARAEIGRALDDLQADGVVVMSNTAGVYLGDPRLHPVLAELDRRRAVVFVHPTTPVGYPAFGLGRPAPLAEFLFDTARTIIDYGLRGTAPRFPNLRVIIPHMGGVIPALADRVELFRNLFREDTELPTSSFTEFLRHVWWDLAGVPSRSQLTALLDTTGPERLLFGSDYCWTGEEAVVQLNHRLEQLLREHLPHWRDTVGDNAQRLLTRTWPPQDLQHGERGHG